MRKKILAIASAVLWLSGACTLDSNTVLPYILCIAGLIGAAVALTDYWRHHA